MKYWHEVTGNGITWVNITRQHDKELKELGNRFQFLAQDIQESLPPFQRPKIVRRGTYYFIVLHFPVFDRDNRRLGFTEVDFFLNGNLLVTVHDGSLASIDSFFSDCGKPDGKERWFSGTAAHLLFELFSRLLDAIFPILLHINEDVNTVDKLLFAHSSGSAVAQEILRLKTNIVTFRRTMQGHRTVLERLILFAGRELNLSAEQPYINSLREYISEIWHMLESQKESINALHETNESILSMRTTQVMKTLTVLSVVTFPLTLLATIFTIRAPHTPFVETPFGFWAIFILMTVLAGLLIAVFKKKGWL